MAVESQKEAERLEVIAKDSWYARGANAATIRYSAEVFSRHWRMGSCLELGPAEGLMTDVLVQHFDDLTVVDGSSVFCEALRGRHSRLNVVHSLFEHFEPERRFDNIVLGHVLEHVEDPVDILRRVQRWLSEGGRVLAAVPNCRSTHRQAAVLMGLLAHERVLNEADLHHGHRRVYDPESFRSDFREAGLRIETFGGYWLKPISNRQIEEQWTPEMLRAFMVLGERYPDIAGEIYVVASHG